jgi:23S rRNA (guanosine2251-2'-O)-methyltransferase
MSKNEFLYGYQTLREIIRHQPQRVKTLFLQRERADERIQELLQWAQAEKIAVIWSSRAELDHMLGTSQHQGMAIACSRMTASSESLLSDLLEDDSKPLLLLILDGIQDPHNLGACIRTANAMGVAAVIAPKDRAAGLTDIVHKTACGATAVTPFIQVTNLARTLREIKKQGVWLVGMDAEAKDEMATLAPGPRVGLILGGEEQGMRRLTREECDYVVSIPMYGTVTSLNVSVAAGMGLYALSNFRRLL